MRVCISAELSDQIRSTDELTKLDFLSFRTLASARSQHRGCLDKAKSKIDLISNGLIAQHSIRYSYHLICGLSDLKAYLLEDNYSRFHQLGRYLSETTARSMRCRNLPLLT